MRRMGEDLEDIRRCGLPLALEAIGERWSFMILRAAFNGLCHFEDYLGELGIARNILANRLMRLTDYGILQRRVCDDDRRRVEYTLTDKGRDLLPALLALRQWGEKYELGFPSNPVLCDIRDRMPIGPVTIRAHDGRALAKSELCWIDEADLPPAARTITRSADPTPAHAVDTPAP